MIIGFDGMCAGPGKAARFFCGHRVPFWVRNADKGASRDSTSDKFGAGFARACYRKIQRQPVRQNVPEASLVI